MVENVVSQALTWGFICECDQLGNMQIFPSQPTEKWELRQAGDRWLLLVSGVPQISLHVPETLAFLERRRLIVEDSEDVNNFD
ncbi:MAG: hypothetical protein WBG73_00990 [Coleofasciculaceae cyanobacterium]